MDGFQLDIHIPKAPRKGGTALSGCDSDYKLLIGTHIPIIEFSLFQ